MKLKRFENFETINESTRYECENCGETLEHEEYEAKEENSVCPQCGESDWSPEQ